MPGLTVILHPLPCLPSDLASGQCQWPGPRSIDLCFRFSAEAWEALGQWATVCSLQQLSPEFRRDRAGPAGRVRQEPCSRPAQGHREPGALWWRSCSAAVRPAALHHPAVIITCTRKTTKYKFTIDTLLRSINPAKPLEECPLFITYIQDHDQLILCIHSISISISLFSSYRLGLLSYLAWCGQTRETRRAHLD